MKLRSSCCTPQRQVKSRGGGHTALYDRPIQSMFADLYIGLLMFSAYLGSGVCFPLSANVKSFFFFTEHDPEKDDSGHLEML